MLLSDEIEQRWHRLPPISIAWIKRLKELGVSVDALCEPELPAQAQVVMHDGFVFDFADEADGQPVDAMIFLARDELGDPIDIVVWEPKLNRMASLVRQARCWAWRSYSPLASTLSGLFRSMRRHCNGCSPGARASSSSTHAGQLNAFAMLSP